MLLIHIMNVYKSEFNDKLLHTINDSEWIRCDVCQSLFLRIISQSWTPKLCGVCASYSNLCRVSLFSAKEYLSTAISGRFSPKVIFKFRQNKLTYFLRTHNNLYIKLGNFFLKYSECI